MADARAPRLCPICRTTPAEGARICAEHGLYALPEPILARMEEGPLLGQVLEQRYALADFIGGGGMGAVYRGIDLRLDRSVAVKVLLGPLTVTREARDRFEAEARAVSRLSSPHTVKLFDYGVIRNGTLAHTAFMVMELVSGESLAARLRRGPVEPAELAALLEQLASSLAEAHGQGIIHRDIKPENILLSHGPHGRIWARLIDFGIARVAGTSRTRSGIVMGTPEYMAPEQVMPSAERPIDARTDVYQLGVVVFEALSGTRPIDKGEPMATAVAQFNEPPPPLPNPVDDPVLARLAPVVARALEKDPGARFESVEALNRAVRDAVGAQVGGSGIVPARVVAEGAAPSGPAPASPVRPSGQQETPDVRAASSPPDSRRRLLLPALVMLTAVGAIAFALHTRDDGPAPVPVRIVDAPADAPEIPPEPASRVATPDAAPPDAARAVAAPRDAALPDAAPAPADRARPARRPRPSRAARALNTERRLKQAIKTCRCEDARRHLGRLQRLDADRARRVGTSLRMACDVVGMGCNAR